MEQQTRIHRDEAVRQVGRLIAEVAHLAELRLPANDYFASFLQRIVAGLAASAGAVWLRTPDGTLRLEKQINLDQVGVEQDDKARQSHHLLLQQVFKDGRPWHRPPTDRKKSSQGAPAGDNPTSFELLITPIAFDREVAGLIEVWLNPAPAAQAAWALQVLVRLSELASLYLHKLRLEELIQRQELWNKLAVFAQQAHRSLDPTEVAYLVANEGRRLIGCDRLSVGLRQAKRVRVEAVSGADLVEQRSNLIQLMRQLFERVLLWGEKLTYEGREDQSLPADVLGALDAYLAVSTSKFLVALPLRDDRETENPFRSVLLLESFEPIEALDQVSSRLDAISQHAASALYNACEYRRIPLPWLWRPIARLQEGVGGKTRAAALIGTLAVAVAVTALGLVPYPLKMDAKGQLLPEVRRWVYSPVEGQVIRFEEGVQPGSLVAQGQSLVLLYDVQLEIKLTQLANEIASAQQAIEALAREETAATTEADRLRFSAEKKQREFLRNRKIREQAAFRERTGSEEGRPGYFWLKSPLTGTVLNSDFRETLTHRTVRPSEPLLRIGDKMKPWEIEIKIPQKHIGHVAAGFNPDSPDGSLDVDLKLLSAPTRTFTGKLSRHRIGSQATPNRDDLGSPEPVILASVQIEDTGVSDEERIPGDLLVTGTEVHAKIRCGNRALGYCLFHSMWEFVIEKISLW
jgi:hypothetical protein